MTLLEKILNGYSQVIVKGEANTKERQDLIEEAVGYFQRNPKPDRKEKFALKNYASFGDQRCDCEPGMGPRHGSIVFSIDYNRTNKDLVVDQDGIDFMLTALVNPTVNLTSVVADYLVFKTRYEEHEKFLNNLKVADVNK